MMQRRGATTNPKELANGFYQLFVASFEGKLYQCLFEVAWRIKHVLRCFLDRLIIPGDELKVQSTGCRMTLGLGIRRPTKPDVFIQHFLTKITLPPIVMEVENGFLPDELPVTFNLR